MSSTTLSPALVLFARGVIARLALWETLTLAVQESWGGPGAKEKRTWMAGVVVDIFEENQSNRTSSGAGSSGESKIDPEYVEDTLLQIMADEFEVHIEDDSAEALGKDIVRLWEVIIGQSAATTVAEKMVEDWESRAERTKGRKIQAHFEETPEEEGEWEDDDSNEDEDGEEEPVEHNHEAPQLIDRKKEPEVDEDGFTLVSRRRR
ncbi:hypothetical protein D9757_008543 [Collybiopsis confluens]|uniref:Pre-rRNA-processing protein TSR2 n=1 Tax=Collybiopsis confluens TaxID=2823264 RepID=A0A8H5LZZ3_9AGAR|nr:hypothetical protein D9757_008543 [Collybiopsis confluens]